MVTITKEETSKEETATTMVASKAAMEAIITSTKMLREGSTRVATTSNRAHLRSSKDITIPRTLGPADL